MDTVMDTNIERTDWNGCYNGGWQAAPLVPEAYSHPAKVSFFRRLSNANNPDAAITNEDVIFVRKPGGVR